MESKNKQDIEKKLITMEVVIAGEKVTLSGHEDPEYFQRVASYLNEKISEIDKKKKSLAVNSFLRTLLISVNIADDLFKEIEKNAQLEQLLESYISEFGKVQEENLYLTERIKVIQIELTNARKELDEYVEAFDKQERYNRNQVYKFKNRG